MSRSNLGSDLKTLIVKLMESGGILKFARNKKNRRIILKAIFDFNNCMASVNPSNLISQADVAAAVIVQPEKQGGNSDESDK